MIEATKDSIRLLSEATSDAIVDRLAESKAVLEELYRSSMGEFSPEEVRQDWAVLLESAERVKEQIKSVSNLEELVELTAIVSESKPLFEKQVSKYSDFLPDRIIKQFEIQYKEIEGLGKLAPTLILISSKYSEEISDDQISMRFYSDLSSWPEILEQYGSYFPKNLVDALRLTSSRLLSELTSLLEKTGSPYSQELIDYIVALNNTVKSVLWQIDNSEKEKKSSVGDLLNWLETSSGWAGDDFEECLDYVNRTRK
jgi:hypothetical protein